MIFENPKLILNGQDVSEHVTNVTISTERETHDDTRFGMSTRTNAKGLKNWTTTVNLKFDRTLDDALYALFDDATPFTFTLADDAESPVSATNPQWEADGFISEYSGLERGMGEEITLSITIIPSRGGSGTHELKRKTTA